jgi:hypothetical protein
MLHRSICGSELLSINVNTGHSSWCQHVMSFEVTSQSYGPLRAPHFDFADLLLRWVQSVLFGDTAEHWGSSGMQ